MSRAKSILIISSSLNDDSISRKLSDYVYRKLKDRTDIVTLCDLRAYNLPFCDGYGIAKAFHDPHVKTMHDMIEGAGSLILASPIYNYSVSATLKNLFEVTSAKQEGILTGNAWRHKLVGFLFGSGTPASFLAGLPFANSLMVDSECLICPNFVLASRGDFEAEVPSSKITDRLNEFVTNYLKIHEKLTVTS